MQNPNGGDWQCNGVYIDNDKVNNFAVVNTCYRQGHMDIHAWMDFYFPTKYNHANIADWGNGQFNNVTDYNNMCHGGLIETLINTSFALSRYTNFTLLMNTYRAARARLKAPQHAWFQIEDFLSTDYPAMRYALTSCLLDDGFFVFTALDDPGNIADFGGRSIVYDEYNGGGKGKGWGGYPRTSPPALGAWYQNGVYRRDYDNMIVLCNPNGNGQQQVSLEIDTWAIAGSQDPIVNNGQKIPAFTPIVINQADGRVLKKAP